MVKNKKLVAVVAGLLGIIIIFGGVFALQGYLNKNDAVSFGAEAGRVILADNDQSAQSQAAPAATSLGQINPNQNNANSAASGSNNSSAPQGLDPTTFSQYEKYKDDNAALFGDLQVGTGATLGANQKAAVLYRGWLTNGQLFDQSRPGADGKLSPFVFTVGSHTVIPGWDQGVVGMKAGGTRLLIIPPAYGYGANGQGSIPPNSVLVFEVRLVEVQ